MINLNGPPLFKILAVEMVDRKHFNMKTVNKSCYVISCRLKGESLFLQNGKSNMARRGDILYIPFGSTYLQESKQETVIYIHLETYSDISSDLKIYKSSKPDYVCSLFKKCYDEFKGKKTNYEYICLSILYEILSLMNLTTPRVNTDSNPTFNFAKQYLDSHIYESDFTIDKLCKFSNISRTYFNQLFKKFYNKTPTNYINDIRIKKAKHLLNSGNYSNDEIAFLCGFNSVKYFYVVFKKLTGQTTLEYKNKGQFTR